MSNQSSCTIRYSQSADPFHIGDRYGGIPLNLLTNLIGSFVIVILFFVIRRSAAKRVGKRIANDTLDNVENITMILFGGRKEEDDKDVDNKVINNLTMKRRRFNTSDTDDEGLSIVNKSECFDKQGDPGADASQYLMFQKYIIVYLFFVSSISLGEEKIFSKSMTCWLQFPQLYNRLQNIRFNLQTNDSVFSK